jgi:hypothetical protein
MQRRKFIAGVGSLAAGAAAVTGTGAFTTASAERKVTVNVVGDQGAYLGLNPTDERASTNSEGALEIDLSALNPNAQIGFIDLFEITNQSDNDLVVSVGKDKNTVYASGVSGKDLLEQAPDISNVFISNEEKNPVGNGLAFGSGAASMVYNGFQTVLLDDQQTNKSSNRYEASKLTPGDSISVDVNIATSGNTNVGSGNYPLIVGAVEPGSDYDQTSSNSVVDGVSR